MFQEHGLLDTLETAHFCKDEQGRQCLRLRVNRHHGSLVTGEQAEKLGDLGQYTMDDRQFVSKAINRSGNEVPKLTYDGTSLDACLGILRSGGLEPREATPAGVYLCPDARTAEASMYNRGLLVACKTRGSFLIMVQAREACMTRIRSQTVVLDIFAAWLD